MRQPSLSKTAAATVIKDSSIHPKCYIKKHNRVTKPPLVKEAINDSLLWITVSTVSGKVSSVFTTQIAT